MPSPSKIKAIVVDDQLTMRTLVRSCLQQIGLTDIREFPKAPEALAALKAQPAHIIFSDFNMPEMDGLEFLRAVRADRAAQFGANNYLVKPFTVAVLKQKLEQIFGALS